MFACCRWLPARCEQRHEQRHETCREFRIHSPPPDHSAPILACNSDESGPCFRSPAGKPGLSEVWPAGAARLAAAALQGPVSSGRSGTGSSVSSRRATQGRGEAVHRCLLRTGIPENTDPEDVRTRRHMARRGTSRHRPAERLFARGGVPSLERRGHAGSRGALHRAGPGEGRPRRHRPARRRPFSGADRACNAVPVRDLLFRVAPRRRPGRHR